MSIRKHRRTGEPAKQHPAKEEPKKVSASKKEEPKAELKKEPEPLEPVVKEPIMVSETKVKKDFSGIGITGGHNELQKFRAVCRFHNKSMGEELLKMVSEWNKIHTIEKW